MAEIVVGNVGRIVSVALKIKEAVETVRQNKKECGDIAKFVARNCALLKRLEQGTEIMMDTVMRDALEDVTESLEEALVLVTVCQQRHIIRRFFGAGDMAKELRQVQEDILRKIMQASFATNIHGIMIMTHVQHAGAPLPPLPSKQVVTDGKEGRGAMIMAHVQHAGTLPPLPLPSEQVVVTDEGFSLFSLSELKAATNDFSDKNIIGEGGSAVIYKGVLRNGLVVAIKNFRDSTNFDTRHMFCNEFGIGVKLQHKNVKNVINVLGYCIDIKLSLTQNEGKYVEVQERQNFLVLGYMPNESLHDITKGTRRIDWSSCFRMMEGIAECVYYLHQQCVVHMDLKPLNILFDSDMNPVIIDFGLSKVLEHDDDEILVQDLMGTMGYVAPEYVEKGLVSTKCDVFAFGITLGKTICSVCTTFKTSNNREREEWDRMVQEAGGVRGLLDSTVQVDDSQIMEIERCMKVALLCTQMDPADRPTMADVVQMLNGEKEIPSPKKTGRRLKGLVDQIRRTALAMRVAWP